MIVETKRSDDSTESNLVDQLIKEQRQLSAVEKFSQKHENPSFRNNHSLYQDQIPISAPKTGEQYSFEVDLDICSGCKACVVACHSQNGLHPDESWRDVGMLLSKNESPSISVTSACHHCHDPACANGCPTLAYEKDQNTGIVRHLDDQCIGCSYCELKCPYDVPKYNHDLGIVRKCDMCHERLAEGEAPACVSACPNGAIKIKIIKPEALNFEGRMLPGTVDSNYTKPTTTFLSSKPLDEYLPADSGETKKTDHHHLPLAWMLALTQLSVGASIIYALSSNLLIGILALVLGVIGLNLSVLHLGQPLKAWKAILGIKKSWLSREILAFGIWMPVLALGLVIQFPIIKWTAVILGLFAVFCSAMVYIDTKRESWRSSVTFSRFFGLVLLAMLAGVIWWPLVLPLVLVAFLEKKQFFDSMTVLKMPGV